MTPSTSIPSIQLKDGISIPVVGYGTGTAWFKKKDIGYHHLDGAEVYGTESELGVAIKESGVPREKLFVTTKVNQNIADIPKAIGASLEKLQLSYVDLYLIHQPFFARSATELQGGWAAMEKVKEAGKARAIRVSNFLESHLETILQSAKIPPAINQIEYHPYLQHASYGPLTPVTRAKGGPLDLLLPTLARKYGVGEGEILLRWSIDCGTLSITTSRKESRLSTYLDAMKFELTPEEKFAAGDRS
ncbi:NADP-dependent oxidoreductase domain-containing protein [Aspergillus aurantiobrunneus]